MWAIWTLRPTVCTSQRYLCIIFSMARFINKNDLVELLEDEVFVRRRTVKLCSECDSPMNLKKNLRTKKLPYFVCARRHKSIRRSWAKGTWFENTKMSSLQVMLMTHCFTTENSLMHQWEALSYLHGQYQNGSISVGRCVWYLWTINMVVGRRLVDTVYTVY